MVMAALGGLSAAASALSVNGLGYEGRWSYGQIGEFYAGALPYSYARATVPWDVATHPSDMASVVAWAHTAEGRGKRVLVSFTNYSATYPSVSDYHDAVASFRAQLPEISEYTAWNEPNHHPERSPGANPTDDPGRAADYWDTLNGLCVGACTVAAGDFLDPDPTSQAELTGFDDYVARYRSALGAQPAVWAIHPYKAVDHESYGKLQSWIAGSTDGKPVWFTEIGAHYCDRDQLEGGTADAALAYQNGRAQSLVSYLQTNPTRVQRVYYYFLTGSSSSSWPAVNDCTDFDTGLLDATDHERPAFRTVFPTAPTPPRPAAATSPAGTTYGADQTLTTREQPHVTFADAADNGSLSDTRLDSLSGWQQSPLFRDQAAAGTSPSAIVVGGTIHAFFVDAGVSRDRQTPVGW
jgi:hypothetical protein